MLPQWANVGLKQIDDRHEGFWQLLEQLKNEKDDAKLLVTFENLIAHTKEHFEAEEHDLQNISSINLYEHKNEHKKAIEEMGYFLEKGRSGRIFFTRSYINERAENWFRQHLLNMDSDLAREIKQKSKEQRFKAVVFDLDGTLLDSLEDIADMANKILKAHNFQTHTIDEFKKFVGYGSRELFVRSSLALADEETVDKMKEEYEELYSQNLSNKSKIYDGIKEVLTKLFKTNLKIAILSNKPDALTKKCVKAFLEEFNFDIVQGEIKGIPTKPDPTSAINIAKSLSLDVENIAFVGDTKTDMQTAKNSGMYAIGVSWGFRQREELLEYGANIVIDSPSELLKALTCASL